MTTLKYIVGIDEAGRGPLAGPVAVGAVIFSIDFDKKLLKEIKGKDSKKLKPIEREVWFKKIQDWKIEGALNFSVSLISAKIIDSKGISFAIKTGIRTCLKNINADCQECSVLLDGSLKAPAEFIYQKTIIKGDEKEQIIGLASICAKVTRDKYMKTLAKKYPKYGFEIHKGYGTELHRKAIKKHGPSEVHRKSFLKNYEK